MRKRKKNPDRSDIYVKEMVLKARWSYWSKGRYILEVFVVGKWRGAGYVAARKPRPLTKKDVSSVAKSVRINIGGEISVMGLQLEE